jgi:translation initiation factor IF-1
MHNGDSISPHPDTHANQKNQPMSDAPKPKEATVDSKDFLKVDGVIDELLPGLRFRVTLLNGHTIIGYLAGKMRMYRIRLLPGDKVLVEMSPYDLTKGRIVYRY